MMSLRGFSNENAGCCGFFNPIKKGEAMETQETKTQEQNIQTNNENEKGETDMNEQLENTVETSELGNDETNEAIVQSTEVAEVIDIITDIDDSTENPLPEGVTAEPRNEEEMHLNHIRQWPDAVKVYLKVSDDAGEVLGSKILERQVKRSATSILIPRPK